ncbi:ABC transporter ATP-binding protein [Cryobacterium sp. CG_9.6]|uniref:ABC transporter ATP-binding protein n=1 Tax=Cryobacterium sp. CG_9.6 TaxID=2760710 RepID=UPI002475F451|nr:ABC transporter ATP-binding protein [Cryobacterium sp. CG_9.6]MDH6236326.1 iron(III) transport system ATP-binding protein [Cryobacterium sp. CG_9.6]
MSSLTIEGLGLTYPNGTAGLTDVDLNVADGEFVALVGPSGSGKTTLLRAIAGFISPSSGSITIGDQIVADANRGVPPERRQLGMVFQQHAIWPHLSVAQNVGYPLKLSRLPRREREARVAEVLQLVGLPGYENRNPATLSGGQRQRIALARALAGSPKLLLLDEALSALDEPLRAALRLELRSLATAIGLTVVHVTHDRDEALAIADRVVVLNEGRILQVASPDELLKRPASAFVASFLSDATLLPGTLGPDAFTALGHPCRVHQKHVDTRSVGMTGPGTLAVLPADIVLHPALEGAEAGVVVSSLFGRTASDVVVTWRGVNMRCSVADRRPRVGERVTIEILRGLFYSASEDGVGQSTATAAHAPVAGLVRS